MAAPGQQLMDADWLMMFPVAASVREGRPKDRRAQLTLSLGQARPGSLLSFLSVPGSRTFSWVRLLRGSLGSRVLQTHAVAGSNGDPSGLRPLILCKGAPRSCQGGSDGGARWGIL